MNGLNILFYSRKCKACLNLLTILKNENLLNYFKLFCVDDHLNSIPPQITTVPTMMVAGVNKLLVAKEIFEWIQNIKFINQQKVNENIDMIKKQLIQKIEKTKSNTLPGFNNLTMNSISDNFAHTEKDDALPQYFLPCQKYDSDMILTAKETGDKIGKIDQIKKIRELESRRETQDLEFTAIMKENQIKAVINADKQQN